MVTLKIKDTSKFYEVTRDISKMDGGDNLIVTWLDFEEGIDSFSSYGEKCGDGNMKCISAAAVSEGLNSNSVTISGNFSKEEAELLAEYINNGSLPTKLVEEATPKSVTATFGEEVIEKTGIEEKIKDCDLVITGEGRLDSQTTGGKAPWGVSKLAKKYGKKVIALCGSIGSDQRGLNTYIDGYFSIVSGPCTLDFAMDKFEAYENLKRTTKQLINLL